MDLETAHSKHWSICQVGLVWFENGLIIDELSILVQPPNNFYRDWFIDIRGLAPEISCHEPIFDEMWHLVETFTTNQSEVSHNGLSFDFPVLAQILQYYGLEVPEYEKHCTYRLFRNNVSSLCQEYSIDLTHY